MKNLRLSLLFAVAVLCAIAPGDAQAQGAPSISIVYLLPDGPNSLNQTSQHVYVNVTTQNIPDNTVLTIKITITNTDDPTSLAQSTFLYATVVGGGGETDGACSVPIGTSGQNATVAGKASWPAAMVYSPVVTNYVTYK